MGKGRKVGRYIQVQVQYDATEFGASILGKLHEFTNPRIYEFTFLKSSYSTS